MTDTKTVPASPEVQRAEAQRLEAEANALDGRAEALRRESERLQASAEWQEKRVVLVAAIDTARDEVSRAEGALKDVRATLATEQARHDDAAEALRRAAEADEEARLTRADPDTQIDLLARRTAAGEVVARTVEPLNRARKAVELAEQNLTAARAKVPPALAALTAHDAHKNDPVPVAPTAKVLRLTRTWQPRLFAAVGGGLQPGQAFDQEEMAILAGMLSMYFQAFGLDQVAAAQERERIKAKYPGARFVLPGGHGVATVMPRWDR